MAITGLKTWADGDALNTTNLNTDKTILEAKFNAGITTADLNAVAGITNAQLANSKYEIVLNLTVRGTAHNGAAAGDILAFAGLPSDTNADTYTVKRVEYFAYAGTGGGMTGDGRIDIDYGYFNAGAWTSSVLVENAAAVPALAATNGENGQISPDNTALTTSTTNNYGFALVLDTADSTFTDSGDIFTVAITLQRTNGLRS